MGDTAVERIAVVRSQRPRLPILLYYPDTHAATSLAARAALLPGVAIRRQTPLLAGESQQIGSLVEHMLAGIPGLTVRFVQHHLLPHVERVLAFVDAAIVRLEQGRHDRAKVKTLCVTLGVGSRTLEQTCHRTGVPCPERLVQWVALLYVAATAEHYRESFADAAKRVGRSGEYVRQLRVRLLPEVATLRDVTPHQLFTLGVLGFARACGLPRARAEDALEKVRAVGSGASGS